MSSGLSADLQKLSSLQFLSYLNEWDLALHVCFICCLLSLSGEAPLHLPSTKIFFSPKWYFYLLMKYATVAHSWGAHIAKGLSQQKWQWRLLTPGPTCAKKMTKMDCGYSAIGIHKAWSPLFCRGSFQGSQTGDGQQRGCRWWLLYQWAQFQQGFFRTDSW